MRLPRTTRRAPETTASAATPEVGLTSGTTCTPASARLERPTNSKAIPANLINYFLRLPRTTRRAPETTASAATPEVGLTSGTTCTPASARLERPTNSKAIPANLINYFLRLPRTTRRAPETNASAATPEAGLISGVATPPAKAKLDKPTKSNNIPMDFKTDLLDGSFTGGAVWTHPPVAVVWHDAKVLAIHFPKNDRTSLSDFVLAVLSTASTRRAPVPDPRCAASRSYLPGRCTPSVRCRPWR